jgi:hypothetical protein
LEVLLALLAENLVDEWLNRQGYFTIRGIKVGVEEIDILAIKPVSGGFEARHVEVQASFRPISFLSKLDKRQMRELEVKSKNSAKARPDKILEQGVAEYIRKKFTSPKKIQMRDSVFKTHSWRLSFVHAVVHEPKELDLMRAKGIELIPFNQVIHSLVQDNFGFSGGAATDIAEIVGYYSGADLFQSKIVKTDKSKDGRLTSGRRIRQLLKLKRLTDRQIVKVILKEFPGRKTTIKDVQWNRWVVKTGGPKGARRE